MKKIFAIMLAVCMLASAFAIFSIPASAAENAWVVYGNAKDYRSDFNEAYGDEYSNVPGYQYIYGEGLKTISPNWENTAPKVGVQTGEKVNLKNGVYMLVRIDEFSYTASDKWFAFSISDTQYVNVGSESKEKDGERVVGLIRSDATSMSQVQWRHSNYQWSGTSNMTAADNEKFVDGKAMLELVITWDSGKSTYNVTINGAPIHETALKWMNEHFADGEAYVGINIQNNEKGGDAGLTVLKYGENEATAIAPYYADSQEPENKEYLYQIADIEDANTVATNEPAIILNGSRDMSDSKTTTKNDGITSLTEEGYKHIAADRTKVEISFSVKNSVSYNITDFPVVLVLTRNLCTCTADECWAFEEANMYLMAGEDIAAGDDRKVSGFTPAVDNAIECDDGNYLYFMVDVSEEEKTADAEGRINGIRFDVTGIDITTPGKNEFDICFVAFFRNAEEAESYVNAYLGVGGEGGEGNETESAPVVDTETESTPAVDTESESASESVSTEKTETEAKVETESKENTGDKPASGGCFGTVGFGAIAIVAVAAVAGFVTLKKKD